MDTLDIVSQYKPLVEQYIKYIDKPLLIAILTPCYGGTMYANYTYKLVATTELFNKLGIGYELQFMTGESLIMRARNDLIAIAMSNSSMTHVMFIDADITWEPIDIVKLILAGRQLVGGVYPFKQYYFDRINKDFLKHIKDSNNTPLSNKIKPDEFFEHNLLKYNLHYLNDNTTTLLNSDNILEIRRLPNGFMLINRSCIEQMMAAYPHTKYTSDQASPERNKYMYALFDCIIVDNIYLSEDWAFCDRWRAIGGKVYAELSLNLKHTGICNYNGRIVSSLDLI
jgi:hypothetical protein